jgi:hypothetical protein
LTRYERLSRSLLLRDAALVSPHQSRLLAVLRRQQVDASGILASGSPPFGFRVKDGELVPERSEQDTLLGLEALADPASFSARLWPTEAAKLPKSKPGEARRPREEAIFPERWPTD